MANYREILRLHSLGTSQRGIAWEVQSSRDTVADIIKAANAAGITWPLDEGITNADLQEILFPGKYAYASPYIMPDFAQVHQDLAKKGVTLTLLWHEYCEKVRATGGVPEVGACHQSNHADRPQAWRRHAGRLGRRPVVDHRPHDGRTDPVEHLRCRAALQLVHLR